jgi:hypothetical protein
MRGLRPPGAPLAPLQVDKLKAAASVQTIRENPEEVMAFSSTVSGVAARGPGSAMLLLRGLAGARAPRRIRRRHRVLEDERAVASGRSMVEIQRWRTNTPRIDLPGSRVASVKAPLNFREISVRVG